MKITLSRNRFLEFGEKPLIMGILNATPDSFHSDSRYPNINEARSAADKMIRAGVDVIDIGGESTRPGSSYVVLREEIQRVRPIVEEIRKHWDIPISVDTRKCDAAKAAMDAGADIINDISALRDDALMAQYAARNGIPVILMHMRGNPVTMQKNPSYKDTIIEIKNELQERIDFALTAGISRESIIIDPGVGFGKRVIDNLRIIGSADSFKELGFPVIIGLSRKSFIKSVLGRKSSEERLAGTLAANIYAAMHGADILRVHDVAETVDCIRMIKALEEAGK
jgi:dihydropteroate synthase